MLLSNSLQVSSKQKNNQRRIFMVTKKKQKREAKKEQKKETKKAAKKKKTKKAQEKKEEKKKEDLKEEDKEGLEQELPAHMVQVDEQRQPISIVFIGHVDVGKSTICGNIMVYTEKVDSRTIEKYKSEAKEKNRDTWWLAYVMDINCLLYTSPSPRDLSTSRMPSSA
eukprot:TRINITY_DN3666_c0_g1_i3.p2 TRINITY_DN3666_c0_g1~~TRINITY_DN3666_c0_g1_i3.p2  ORF type:complete len:167 (+),score=42.43 TRINITY_DN3666_c0_g1_i3:365-865(+)